MAAIHDFKFDDSVLFNSFDLDLCSAKFIFC